MSDFTMERVKARALLRDVAKRARREGIEIKPIMLGPVTIKTRVEREGVVLRSVRVLFGEDFAFAEVEIEPGVCEVIKEAI